MVIAEHLAAGQNRLKHTILKEVLHAGNLNRPPRVSRRRPFGGAL